MQVSARRNGPDASRPQEESPSGGAAHRDGGRVLRVRGTQVPFPAFSSKNLFYDFNMKF